MAGTPWAPGGGLALPVPAAALSDGCRSTHFLPGRHGPCSTWDLSKPTRIVLLPSHSLQALPTPLRTHPLLPEAFSIPSPGARPPSGARHADPQLHCTLICRCWPRICLSGVAGAMLVLLITIHPLPARPEEPSVSRCPLNNQRLFQSSRVQRLLPRTS